MEAANNGHTQIVQALIRAGADVNAQDEHGYTALMLATWAQDTQIVQSLLNANADVTIESNFGETTFNYVKDPEISHILKSALKKAEQERIKNEEKIAKKQPKTKPEEPVKTEEKTPVENPENLEFDGCSRTEKRQLIKFHKEQYRQLLSELTTTTPERHALAVKLQEIRTEYGHEAKKIAKNNRVVQALRRKINEGHQKE